MITKLKKIINFYHTANLILKGNFIALAVYNRKRTGLNE